jgi:predicted O-methyltransferase YrrM
MKSRIQFAKVPPVSSEDCSSFRRTLDHPFFVWAGLRPPIAQHTKAEHEALMRYARAAQTAVEIGVAQGASAAAIREAMPAEGTLYLIDPFHLSRVPTLNFLKRAAQRLVKAAGKGRTVWIEAFSHDAVCHWKLPIDFLLIDGDHREVAVEQDWRDWSPYVSSDGIVAFHDARQFPSGWPSPDYGTVRFMNRFFRQGLSAPWIIIEEVDSLVFVSRIKRL